ncbi:DNA cytosine methyltransferase [Pantoea agglomerans]|uniref:DNA cytosine methyltransferase n=1 Tax=Enterobacter agglomerans TaxID=549 RepID=UPI001F4F41A6|nr:DNA cytosine methyltransferase [Pantoea agglomerans]
MFMTAYYNEFDPFAAQWLRNLIDAGHIAPGVVDDRSIADVTASDLTGFTQCHFFAGIGGWSYALRLAGIPDDFPCWTGSPPCQPFSVAGKQLGQLDERHLAPTFMRLVDQCRPPVLFGEQVAAAIGKHWLDDLFTELERQGYACGAAVLPAASVGAPHKRDRLFFGAALLEHSGSLGRFKGGIWNNRAYDGQQSAAVGKSGGLADNGLQQRQSAMPGSRTTGMDQGGWNEAPAASAGCGGHSSMAYAYSKQFNGRGNIREGGRLESSDRCDISGLADANDARSQGWQGVSECTDQQLARAAGLAGCMADADGGYSSAEELQCILQHGQPSQNLSFMRGGAAGVGSGHNPANAACAYHSFWSDADWLLCRDGKFRPVRSGSFPLANGVPARVGRLRGYGNAISPQVAAEFVAAFMRCL